MLDMALGPMRIDDAMAYIHDEVVLNGTGEKETSVELPS